MIIEYDNPVTIPLTPKKSRNTNFFWLGFMLYTAASTLAASTPGNNNAYAVIQIGGLLLCLPAAWSLIKFRIENRYLKVVYYIYIVWLFFVILRGLPFDFTLIKKMLFDAWYGMFLYFVPLVLLLPKNLFFYKRVFDVIVVLNILYIIYVALFRTDLLNPDGTNITSQQLIEFFSKNLSIPAGFLLLTYVYQSRKRKLLALFVILLTFVLAMIRARRGLAFMAISSFIFAFGLYFYANKGKLINIFYAVVLVAALGVYGVKVFKEDKNTLFSLIMERADEDTRSEVEEFFYKDMKTKDWLIGKGINGDYFCPGIDADGFSNYRDSIETDYLNMILKGGLISLVLLLLIAIPAVIKGLFRSRNVLSKAASIWIFLWLIDLYPSNVTTFNLNYIIVWISIGICYSPAIRNIREEDLREFFSGPIIEPVS